MSFRVFLPILISLFVSAGCSSQSELANTSTSNLGEWSPLSSRQVSRQTHFTLAAQYKLVVAHIENRAGSDATHDSEFSQALAQQLQQHRLTVTEVASFASVEAALSSARATGADILLVAQVQRWPAQKANQCGDGDGAGSGQSCPEEHGRRDMALSLALYDVRDGRMVDSISARSQRGLSGRMYDNAAAELEQLCKMIASRLSAY